MKKLIWVFLKKIGLGAYVQLFLKSALHDEGWFTSFNKGRAINANGQPIPWCAYSFIHFLEPRLKKNFRVFEYGSGNSSLWYADRTASVTAVEHDRNWFESLKMKLPSNVSLIFRELRPDSEYAREVLVAKTRYDLIVVDGRDRNNCIRHAMNCLAPEGVLILDNSQIEEYREGIQLLLNADFKRIDFIGMTPVIAHNNVTTIFYRAGNCLDI